MESGWINILLLVIAVTCFPAVVNAQNASITIPLNKPLTPGNKELYGNFFNVNSSSTLQINIELISKNVSFIIFQTHSFLNEVVLYNNSYTKGSYINGTNIGVYSSVVGKLDTFYVFNPNNISLKVYVSIHGYAAKDPVPGGCNLEFPMKISPFLKTKNFKDYLYVDAAYPQFGNCDMFNAEKESFDFFQLYLNGGEFDEDAYFNGIQSLMTKDGIEKNGRYVPKSTSTGNRRIMSAYPGKGAVYVVAAASKTGEYSIYVPIVTYACSPGDDDCDIIDNSLSKILCASLFFTGFFMCYFGHRFFQTNIFLVGMMSGFLITYIVMSLIVDLNSLSLTTVCLISSLLFGAIWLLFWWFYGLPMFSILLSSLNVGFLTASILYYSMPGQLTAQVLDEDTSFWSLFICTMLLISLAVLLMTIASNVICCSVLGASAIVFPFDYYIKSNLKYIIINTVRRAIVPKFSKALIMPPFQFNDALISVLWVALIVSGFWFQHYHNRGRPPFPPPPRSIRATRPEERASQVVNVRRRYGAIDSSPGLHYAHRPIGPPNNESSALLQDV